MRGVEGFSSVSGEVPRSTVDTATGAAAPGELSTRRVQSIFSKIAPRYGTFNALSSFGVYRRWLKAVAKVAAVTPDMQVLDLAAGTGDVAFEICRRTPPAHVDVTDFNEEMLAVARDRYAAGAGCGVPCDFATVDAQDIPCPDDTYDLVTCAYGVRNIPDRMKAFQEAYRVLKPGGRYVILEFSKPPFTPWRMLYHAYLRHMIPFVGGCLTGDREGFVYLNDSILAFPDQETLAGCLRDTGFSEVKYENHSGGIAAIHTATK